jgi:hypothetical protein
MPPLLQDVRKAMKLTGSEIVTPELQDRMGREALKIAGYDDYLNGKKTLIEFRRGLARYWGSIPDPTTERLHYPNQHQGTNNERVEAVIGSAKAEAEHFRDVGIEPGPYSWR